MRRRRAIPALLAIWAVAGGAAPGPAMSIEAQRQRLATARRAAAQAGLRAEQLLVAAALESDAATRAAAEQRGLAERVAAAEAGLVATQARAAIVTRLLAQRRAALAQEQAPLARLLAAMQSLTLRPAAAAMAQPGSVDDLVHLRAVLSSVIPVMRARTAGIRAEVAATRRLRTRAVQAGEALRMGRSRLDAERATLAEAEARHRVRADALGRGALSESDRALALGEAARDLVEQLAEGERDRATVAALVRLPGPVARPVPGDDRMAAPADGAYRLPVAGRLVTGFGEISAAGVRSRGLTFAVPAAARVVAPAGGVVRFADRFRGYGRIVIIDHGEGWTSLITGMAALDAAAGRVLRAGDPLGRAATGEASRVTVELRRGGVAVDAAALIG